MPEAAYPYYQILTIVAMEKSSERRSKNKKARIKIPAFPYLVIL